MSAPPAQPDRTGITVETLAPAFAVDEKLKIVLWNDAAEALLGFARAEVVGRPCHEVLGCSDRGRRSCNDCFDQQLSARSGERVWVNVTTVTATSGKGGPLRVHVLRELTAQKKLEELLRQIVSTASEVYLAPSGGRAGGLRPRRTPLLVTPREREVVRLLAQGSSTKAIAARLGISCRTARNHIQNVLCKLHVHSRVEVVAYASKRDLV